MRINSLVDHAESMLTLLQDLRLAYPDLLAGSDPDPHMLAFISDIQNRITILEELIEEDILNQVMGLNNLLGPLKHLLKYPD
jgi:hypothetical protein